MASLDFKRPYQTLMSDSGQWLMQDDILYDAHGEPAGAAPDEEVVEDAPVGDAIPEGFKKGRFGRLVPV